MAERPQFRVALTFVADGEWPPPVGADLHLQWTHPAATRPRRRGEASAVVSAVDPLPPVAR